MQAVGEFKIDSGFRWYANLYQIRVHVSERLIIVFIV